VIVFSGNAGVLVLISFTLSVCEEGFKQKQRYYPSKRLQSQELFNSLVTPKVSKKHLKAAAIKAMLENGNDTFRAIRWV
jgi:hypothetical protein